MRQALRVDARHFSYLETGGGHDRTLVLVHAFPVHASMWQPQLDAPPGGWRVLAPNLADSERARTGKARPSRSTTTRRIWSRCSIGSASHGQSSPACHSAGKWRSPSRGSTRSGSPALSLLTPRRRPTLQRRVPAATGCSRSCAIAAPRALPMRCSPGCSATRHPPGASDNGGPGRRDDRHQRTRGRAPCDPAAARPADATPGLAAVRVPVLVAVGDEDVVTPPAEAERYATAIPGAQLARIALAGHLSSLEQPSSFGRVLADFLARV